MKLILTREDRWPHSLIQQRSWRTSVLDTALGPGGIPLCIKQRFLYSHLVQGMKAYI